MAISRLGELAAFGRRRTGGQDGVAKSGEQTKSSDLILHRGITQTKRREQNGLGGREQKRSDQVDPGTVLKALLSLEKDEISERLAA